MGYTTLHITKKDCCEQILRQIKKLHSVRIKELLASLEKQDETLNQRIKRVIRSLTNSELEDLLFRITPEEDSLGLYNFRIVNEYPKDQSPYSHYFKGG